MISRYITIFLTGILFFLTGCNQQISNNNPPVTKNSKEVILEGKYVEGKYAYTKHWGYDCYLVDNNKTHHEVECLKYSSSQYPNIDINSLKNKTIRIYGEKIIPEKTDCDQMQCPMNSNGQTPSWPPYIKINKIEIIK